jgi:NADH:ubiquinone oxidoreductase subunit 6 (subunit J)
MVPVLILIALVIAFGGFLFLSQATAGVYLAAVACLFAIFARMRQAHEQHLELRKRDQVLPSATTTSSAPHAPHQAPAAFQ